MGKIESGVPVGVQLLAGGVGFGLVGGMLKFFSSKSMKEANHLRSVPRMDLPEIREALSKAAPGTRIYAATEGLTTARDRLIEAADGEKVIVHRTKTVEVNREWEWKSTGPARRGRAQGYWKSKSRDSSSVETNDKHAGLGLFSGSATAFIDSSALRPAIDKLLTQYSERFEARQAGPTVIVNNNNNGSNRSRGHSDPERPPPPESLGFRKTEYVIRNEQLAFAVGEFYQARDHLAQHRRSESSTSPPSPSLVLVGEPVIAAKHHESDIVPTFRVGYGTVQGEIRRISKHAENLNTIANIALVVGGGLAVGGVVKTAIDASNSEA